MSDHYETVLDRFRQAERDFADAARAAHNPWHYAALGALFGAGLTWALCLVTLAPAKPTTPFEYVPTQAKQADPGLVRPADLLPDPEPPTVPCTMTLDIEGDGRRFHVRVDGPGADAGPNANSH